MYLYGIETQFDTDPISCRASYTAAL